MTRSKFDAFVSKQAVTDAWKVFWKSARNQTASGVDGMTPQAFAESPERHIEAIFRDLRRGYVFSPLKPFAIEKSNGKKRIICVGTVRDRIVQRMVAEHLSARADKLGILNDASFGFIKSTEGNPRGVSAARDKAVAYRQSFNWAYKSDISAFFDNIQRDQLVFMTIRALRAESFGPIIRAIVSCEIDNTDKALARLAEDNGIKRGLGVRQGMPLSPLLSNVVLKDFDKGMLKRGYKMVRYADDFIVLAGSREECEEIDRHARNLLSKLRLELPTLEAGTKTEIVGPAEPIDFLGLSLQRTERGDFKLIITQDQIGQIKRKLGELKDVDRLVRERITFTGLGRKLKNSIGGYRAAYTVADNVDDLEKMLSSLEHDTLRGILISTFGDASVQKLNQSQRIFMGIEAPGTPASSKRRRS